MIEIVQPLLLNRNDSCFYSGQIAYYKIGNITYSLEAVGEVGVLVGADNDGEGGKFYRHASELIADGIKDSDLPDGDFWSNNNWFEIVIFDDRGDYIDTGDSIDAGLDYTEAIGMLDSFVADVLKEFSNVIDGIDWDLLQKQKIELLELINDHEKLLGKYDGNLEGLVNLIDNLQDTADNLSIWKFPDFKEEE